MGGGCACGTGEWRPDIAEFPGFCGPSNTQASRTSDSEQTVNLFVRMVDAGTPKAKPNLYRRPGLKLWTFLGPGPVAALNAQDGQVFGVAASVFYEILPSKAVVARGYVQPSPIAATISFNGRQGHQVFITSGGHGYIYDTLTEVFTKITDDAFPTVVSMGLFFDSSFLALNAETGAFVVSGLYDGLTWNGLDQGIQSQTSDQTVALLRSHDNLLLLGTRNTAPWIDSGSGGAAGFVPAQGTIIEHGIGAPFTAVELDNTAWWLGQDAQGSRMVWRMDGYTPVRVSTHAVEYDLSKVTSIWAARAWAYQEQGHSFYVLYVPGLELTWVYDLSTQLWFQWGHWSTVYGQWFPYVGVNHCFTWDNKHLVGDRQSGAVYEQSLGFFEDALVPF